MIGESIKNLREFRGVSQSWLATRCGLSQQHISQIESGKISPTFDTFVLILNALDAEITVEPRKDSVRNNPVQDTSIPCYLCAERSISCHSTCERYLEYRKKRNAYGNIRNAHKI